MYTLSSWSSHFGIVGIDILHQKMARTEEDPLIAYISKEVT